MPTSKDMNVSARDRAGTGGYIVPDATLFDSDLAEWEYMKEKEAREQCQSRI